MPHRFSNISRFHECPLAFQFQTENKPTVTSAPLRIGSFAHRVFAAYTNHCCAQRRGTDITAITDIARSVYAATPVETDDYLSRGEFEECLSDVLLQFVDRHVFDFANIAGIEERMAFDRDMQPVPFGSDDTWFHGTIDLLMFSGDTAHIIDYKTGWGTKAHTLQMEVYAWLVFSAYRNIQTVETEFDFTRYNMQKSETFSREFDFPRIDATVRRYCADIEAALADKLTLGVDLPPTPGPHCAHCHFQQWCTYVPQMLDAINTPEQAKTVVDDISVLERDMKRLKEKLRLWVDTYGPVRGNGVVWGHHPSTTMVFDPAAFMEVVDNGWQYLAVNGVKVKKLCKKGVWPESLEAIGVTKTTTRFMGKKQGDDDDE